MFIANESYKAATPSGVEYNFISISVIKSYQKSTQSLFLLVKKEL